jgi:hypothetical protein
MPDNETPTPEVNPPAAVPQKPRSFAGIEPGSFRGSRNLAPPEPLEDPAVVLKKRIAGMDRAEYKKFISSPANRKAVDDLGKR